MITIKLLGGAKKSFGSDVISVDFESITVAKLVDYLISIKPANTAEFDSKNILVAVNGVDSSALEGADTQLQSGDTVSIIPIIHGGAASQFSVKPAVGLFFIRCKKGRGYELLEEIRTKFPGLVVEGISKECVLSPAHAKKITAISLRANSQENMLSKKLHTDILLRFAGTRQISEAIKSAGIGSVDSFFLIVIGDKALQRKLRSFVKPYLSGRPEFAKPGAIQRKFKVTKLHLSSVGSDAPLEDILVERAAVLFR